MDSLEARALLTVADSLVRKSVWVMGGDGWAYDIGFGGLDHVLGSGQNVKVLVLDTETYSNTGGQMSKSTPRGAVAKFAEGGKPNSKKDMAMEAVAYGSVYVARVAMGSSDMQTVKAFQEAEAYNGPALIMAYSHCIAHGYDLTYGMEQQKSAVLSGYWPLMRYNPTLRAEGKNPFQLDSKAPSIPLKQYAYHEARYTMLARSQPEVAKHLLQEAQDDVERTWRVYSGRAAMAGRSETPHIAPPEKEGEVAPLGCGRRRRMIDLSTEYLGLKLKSPLVVSSSPLTESPENIQRLEEAGAAAVVLPSIFEEQLTLESNALDRDLSRGTESFAESLSYFPAYEDYRQGQDAYLSHIRRAKSVAGIPVLASLNGATARGWVRFAKEIEQAGADALELNTYSLATDPAKPAPRSKMESSLWCAQVKAGTRIPVAVKLSPQFTSIPHLAAQAGQRRRRAAGAVQPLLSAGLRHREPQCTPRLTLSRPEELLLRLHWTAILYGDVSADIAVTGGVHSAEDVLKSIMAGGRSRCWHRRCCPRYRTTRHHPNRSGPLDGGA